MGLVDVLLSLCTFWAGLHALKHVLRGFHHSHTTRQLTRSRAVLPVDSGSPSPALNLAHYVGHKVARIFANSKVEVNLSAFNLRVETTAFDRYFAQISAWSLVSARKKHFAEILYSAGTLAGLFGMGAVYVLLFWSSLSVLRTSSTTRSFPNKTSDFQDDGPLSSSDEIIRSNSGLAVQPIIPGVTVPLSHLPILLAALLLSQVAHEAGHAMTALLENVPIHSVGLGLFVCLPSAFVSLNSVAFGKLSPRPRMRIAAAGACHNLVLWLAITTLTQLGLGQIFEKGWTGWGTPFGPYKRVDDIGVAVHSVEPGSDLSHYLYPRDIIARIEDARLAHAHLLTEQRTPLQLWHDLLLHHHRNVTIDGLPDMGWCVDSQWYKAQPPECCTSPSSTSLVCFSSFNSTAPGFCLDPFKIFSPPETPMALAHGRCATTCITKEKAAAEDEPDQTCVRPKGVTRIGVVRGNEPEQTVLWSGPSEEIWEQVHVSDIAPRYWFVPLGLPETVDLFVSYTLTITLSLFFLNLLPIRRLDGAQLLSAFLDTYTPKPSASFPLSRAQHSAEEGQYHQFEYETPGRSQISQRYTSSPSGHPLTYPINGVKNGWVARNRSRIEKIAEGTAIGLVLLVVAGNAYLFST